MKISKFETESPYDKTTMHNLEAMAYLLTLLLLSLQISSNCAHTSPRSPYDVRRFISQMSISFQ